MNEVTTNHTYNIPYNIGDTLYCINKRKKTIDEMIISSIVIDKDGLMVKVDQPRIGVFDLPIRERYIQNTVFTSYDEAARFRAGGGSNEKSS